MTGPINCKLFMFIGLRITARRVRGLGNPHIPTRCCLAQRQAPPGFRAIRGLRIGRIRAFAGLAPLLRLERVS